jgi:hypothetical protein
MNRDLQATNQSDVPTVKVGLLGGPRAGKTSYLAIMHLMIMRLAHSSNWFTVTPGYHISELFHARSDLLTHRVFPPGIAAITAYELFFRIRVPRGMGTNMRGNSSKSGVLSRLLHSILRSMSRLSPGHKRLQRTYPWLLQLMHGFRSANIVFKLQMLDYPGGALGKEGQMPSYILKELSSCDGFLLLFDPESDSNKHYLGRALETVWQEEQQHGGLESGRLRKWCAACVAKYDSPEVFLPMMDAGLITEAVAGVPLPDDSKNAFEFMSSREGGYVSDRIKLHFHPQQTSYYMSSNIGFYKANPHGPVDLDDFANTYGTPLEGQIRGPIRPINILEPLLWICLHHLQPGVERHR